MVTFTFYIRDDRYSVPTLDLVNAHSEDAVRTLVAKRLFESHHHTAIEVYEGEELRFSATPGAGWMLLH